MQDILVDYPSYRQFLKKGIPSGITKVGNKFRANPSVGHGKVQHLGYFNTVEEANAAIKGNKKENI